jgi:hypothetical protein
MAQATQKAPTPPAKTSASPTADAAQPASRFRFKLPSFLSPNNPDGTPRSGWSRLITGMLVLFIGFYAISFLIDFIFSHLPRAAQDAMTAPLASKNTFLLGGLSGLTLVWFLLIAGFYIALFRFNIIPRDPFNSRARAEARVAASRSTNTGGAVKLEPQSRASRRQAAATAAASAKTGKNGKTVAKTTIPIMKAKAGQTAATTTRAKTTTPSAAQSGTHDAEYDRVKALQRQQRRREAKR